MSKHMSAKIFVPLFSVINPGAKFCMFYCKTADLPTAKSEKTGGGLKKPGD